MDEEFDTSFDTSDTDFSSDIDTTDVDYDTSSDLDMDDASYDTLDDISDDVSDFGTESEDYDTLDDISDIESDEMDYDTLDDIGEDMPESEFEESNFENVTDEASEDVPEADLTEETSDVETDVGDNMDEVYSDDEYETLEDVPDEATIVEANEDSDIETLDDIQEDEFVTEEEEPEYETLDDIPDNEDETVVDEQEIETLEDISDEQSITESLDDAVEEPIEESDTMDNDEDEVFSVDENPDVSLNEMNGETVMDDSIENDLQDDILEETTNEVSTESNEPEAIETTEPEVNVEGFDTAQDTSDLDSAIDKIMNSDLSAEHKKELLQNLRDEVSIGDTNTEFNEDDAVNQPDIYQETEEQDMDNFSDDDSPKVLKRDLTDEELAARDRDTEETLDNYRENLRDYGVDEETIEEFIDQERDKINAEYESLDNGDTSSNIYHMPTNWEEVANELKNPENASDSTNVEQIAEAQDINDISGWLGDINPNFDEFDPESPYCNNCGSCAFAVYNRLNGDTDMCASAENIGYNDEMNALTGMEQVSMSPDEIESRLLAEGNGAHAIIGIDRAQGPGHWFNAACVDGKVVAIDGQTGEILDWPPDYGDVVNWEMSVKKGDK